MEEKPVKNKSKKTESDPKINKVVLYNAVARKMCGSMFSNLPDIPEKFIICNINKTNHLYYLIDESNIATEVDFDYLIRSIHKYVINELSYSEIYAWDATDCKKVIEAFIAISPLFPAPDFIRFQNENKISLKALPYDFDFKGSLESDIWNEFLNRLSDPIALCSFVGSLFFPGADTQQYLWLYGSGQNSKGSFTNFIVDLFGPSALTTVVPNVTDNFWSWSLMNKRVVIFDDINNKTFITSGRFKSLTGGDHIPVEQKYGNRTHTKLNCKFIVTSNKTPKIGNNPADLRRAIFIEADAAPSYDPDYRQKLIQDGQKFVLHCLCHYFNNCVTMDGDKQKHGRIPTKENANIDLANKNEGEYVEAFENCFTYDKDCCVPGGNLTIAMRKFFPNKTDMSDFRDWLEKQPGIIYGPHRIGKEIHKCWQGIKPSVQFSEQHTFSL